MCIAPRPVRSSHAWPKSWPRMPRRSAWLSGAPQARQAGGHWFEPSIAHPAKRMVAPLSADVPQGWGSYEPSAGHSWARRAWLRWTLADACGRISALPGHASASWRDLAGGHSATRMRDRWVGVDPLRLTRRRQRVNPNPPTRRNPPPSPASARQPTPRHPTPTPREAGLVVQRSVVTAVRYSVWRLRAGSRSWVAVVARSASAWAAALPGAAWKRLSVWRSVSGIGNFS